MGGWWLLGQHSTCHRHVNVSMCSWAAHSSLCTALLRLAPGTRSEARPGSPVGTLPYPLTHILRQGVCQLGPSPRHFQIRNLSQVTPRRW